MYYMDQSYDYILKLAEDFKRLAFKPLKGVLRKINIPLMVLSNGNFITIIPIKETEKLFVPTGMVSLDMPTLAMNPGFDRNEWRRIAAIWADDSWTALYLLGAALYYSSRLVTDHSVTPAAQAVMKRLYEKNKDNPTLITPNVLVTNEQTADKPWMVAGYLNSGENNQQYASAIKVGEELKQIISEDQLIAIVQSKWETAEADPIRTGEDVGEKLVQPIIENVELEKQQEPAIIF